MMEDYKILAADMAIKEENYDRILAKYEQLLKDFTVLTNQGIGSVNPLKEEDYELIFTKYKEVRNKEKEENDVSGSKPRKSTMKKKSKAKDGESISIKKGSKNIKKQSLVSPLAFDDNKNEEDYDEEFASQKKKQGNSKKTNNFDQELVVNKKRKKSKKKTIENIKKKRVDGPNAHNNMSRDISFEYSKVSNNKHQNPTLHQSPIEVDISRISRKGDQIMIDEPFNPVEPNFGDHKTKNINNNKGKVHDELHFNESVAIRNTDFPKKDVESKTSSVFKKPSTSKTPDQNKGNSNKFQSRKGSADSQQYESKQSSQKDRINNSQASNKKADPKSTKESVVAEKAPMKVNEVGLEHKENASEKGSRVGGSNNEKETKAQDRIILEEKAVSSPSNIPPPPPLPSTLTNKIPEAPSLRTASNIPPPPPLITSGQRIASKPEDQNADTL